MRIMTSSRLRSDEQAIKFKNRPEKDMIHDEEYQRYKEEMANTLKMSLILKSLNKNNNGRKKGSKSLAVSGSGLISSGSIGSRTKPGTGTGVNMTSAQVSN